MAFRLSACPARTCTLTGMHSFIQLYNQVRHIVALLFLVGARLEQPSIVDRLLWTSDRTATTERMNPLQPGEDRPLQDAKPGYEMADDLPLILWQCGFNSSQLSWRVDNTARPGDVPLSEGTTSVTHETAHPKNLLTPEDTFRRQFLEMSEAWTQQRLKAVVLKHHLASFCQFAPAPEDSPGTNNDNLAITPNGAGRSTHTRNYIPLFDRPCAPTPDQQNARWAAGRGQRRMQMRADNQEHADATREVNLAKKAEAQRLAKQEAEERLARRVAAQSG